MGYVRTKYSHCYLDDAADVARRHAATILREKGFGCSNCPHPMHGGRCPEPNPTPLSPFANVPAFCTCTEGKVAA